MWVCCFVEFCFYYMNYCWYSEIRSVMGGGGVYSTREAYRCEESHPFTSA